MIRTLVVMVALLPFSRNLSASAQTNTPQTSPGLLTNYSSTPERSEHMRAACINGRRSICGKILRIFPDGLLVESGYTNLLREPLTRSWLVPGTVLATAPQHLVEGREPGATCVGTIFLTDLPRGKPKQYDYVIICGYPTGEFTYKSVGALHKTVRRFSANLDRAVKLNLAAPPGQKAR